MERPDWALGEIDTERPTAARIYDYLLGGSHNFAVDRAIGDQLIAGLPDSSAIVRANRAFLRRAVTYCAAQGIDQFLDIGSGIPTLGNVHEVAQQANPEARVVYVDLDPVAVEHSRSLLVDNDRATVIEQNLRNAEEILEDPQVRGMLDLRRPVTLILAAVVHFIAPEEDPVGLLGTYREAFAPGSFMVLSHGTNDEQDAIVQSNANLYRRTATPGYLRTKKEFEELFTGFELVEPGVTWTAQWRPDDPSPFAKDPRRSALYAAVGRKA
jgi:hypothetical protein